MSECCETMDHVPNDRLRAAIHAKGLTLEDLSVRVGVDPKTVERWIGDDSRRPHRKSRQRLRATREGPMSNPPGSTLDA
jgi:transcriptional regulator with XRE-family HTH domain